MSVGQDQYAKDAEAILNAEMRAPREPAQSRPDNRVTGGAQPAGATHALNGNLSSGELTATPLDPEQYRAAQQQRVNAARQR